MNIIVKIILLLVTCTLKANSGEYKYEEITNAVHPALSGKYKVNYGYDDKGGILYIVIAPTQNESGLLIKYIFRNEVKFSEAHIEYHGLILDEPCKCKPFVICTGNAVKRYSMKKINSNEIIKIINAAGSIEELRISLAVDPK